MLIEKERDIEMENTYIFTYQVVLTHKKLEIYNKKIKQSYGEFTNTFLLVLGTISIIFLL